MDIPLVMSKKEVSFLSKDKNHRTHNASYTKRQMAMEKRFKIQNQFIEDVFPVICKCGKCKSRKTINFRNLCMSWNEISKTATTLGIKTPTGKTNWERIQVKRVVLQTGKQVIKKKGLDEFFD
tara:strand:+ start:2358 stop:2726 length:369 start_codon:yes stop_codon:yes gene_type:complete